MAKRINNAIVVSDLHCGCQMGLYPGNAKLRRDAGGMYLPSPLQGKVWGYWNTFWNQWVPDVTKGEPYCVIVNGDSTDGRHHGATHQITHNLAHQARIARAILQPIVEKCEGRFYMVRGTEAHVGPSGENEEELAESLGAIPNEDGNYARFELWKEIGAGLIHVMHHIGCTGSSAYEATAVHKELTESFTEAGRWGERAPDIIVRSHRHRFMKTEFATHNTRAIAVVTPGWQAKTPFVWKIAGGRLSPPQFGGILIRHGDKELFTNSFVKSIKRGRVE